MLSKSTRNLGTRTNGNLGMKICKNQIMVNTALTNSLLKTNPINKKRRVKVIQIDLSGYPPFPLNHHFELVVLINHDIHPFDGGWNVISSSFVNYIHHLMIS
jgi:hypothetical protein